MGFMAGAFMPDDVQSFGAGTSTDPAFARDLLILTWEGRTKVATSPPHHH